MRKNTKYFSRKKKIHPFFALFCRMLQVFYVRLFRLVDNIAVPRLPLTCKLIPIHTSKWRAALFVFQISQQRRFYTDNEIITRMRSERNKVGRHGPTMQISGNGTRRISDFFCIEIVHRIKSERPVLGKLDVTTET